MGFTTRTIKLGTLINIYKREKIAGVWNYITKADAIHIPNINTDAGKIASNIVKSIENRNFTEAAEEILISVQEIQTLKNFLKMLEPEYRQSHPEMEPLWQEAEKKIIRYTETF